MPILLRIDAERACVFEVQATILAVLAWPEEVPDGSNLAAAQVALGGHLMRAAVTADPSWAHLPQWLKPVYLLQGPQEVANILAKAMNRLRGALRAARIARPFVSKALGQTPILPKEIARLSLEQAVPWVLGVEGASGRNPHKFEQDVLRRTYPVLHLALALERVLHERQMVTGRRPALEALMMGDEPRDLILQAAEALEPVLLSVSSFRVNPDRQIRIRLVRSAAPPTSESIQPP